MRLSLMALLAAACFQLPAQDPAQNLAQGTAQTTEFFETKIRPVLAKSCQPCHAAGNKMAGLDMASREGLLAGGVNGPSLVPGKPEASLLIAAVTHRNEKLKMPLGQSKLAPGEIADLENWVRAGAFWPAKVAAPAASQSFAITDAQKKHWAYQPLKRSLTSTGIDSFLAAQRKEKGVVAAAPASKRTLLRRVTYSLTGLPPTATEIEAFEKDSSPTAFAKVVDRLLASPRYGERWGRHWLDVARYSDDRLEAEVDAPYENAFRYRDWVIDAFNSDMPYSDFVKAQIAGDLMSDPKKYSGGLGLYALRPDTQDDRVDVTGRAFLGLTTGCAQCHNHKFDPIPTTDYYALQGVFSSTEESEFPLAPEAEVKAYQAQAKLVKAKQTEITDFLHDQATQLATIFANQTARYVTAARLVLAPGQSSDKRLELALVAKRDNLDQETLARWVKYLGAGPKDHPYLKDWNTASFDATAFEAHVLRVLAERREVDKENDFRAGVAKRKDPKQDLVETLQAVSLKTESFYLWRDLFFSDYYGKKFKQEDDGLLYYGPNRGYLESDGTVERMLTGHFTDHLARLRAQRKDLEAKLPAHYAFLHTIKDAKKLKTERVKIGGSPDNLGEDTPRRFLTILGAQPFASGSGRLELADAIASDTNPLTARVIANRVWHYHFGSGIVKTLGDFGFMGDRPSNPALLDHLASRLIDHKWSLKSLHREILLSNTYQLGAARHAKNEEIDPDNRTYWRANVRRLDAEALRDSLLSVSGELSAQTGGPPTKLTESTNHNRTVYGFVSRRKTDGTLSLFDFPNPNITSDKRSVTLTPPQQLFLLNSEFTIARAEQLARGVSALPADQAVETLYRRIYGRAATPPERSAAKDFFASSAPPQALIQYTQALLSANEFILID